MKSPVRQALALTLLTAAACSPAADSQRLRYEPGPSPLTEMYGISPGESARRLNQQEHIGELAGRLIAAYPDRFSSLWVEHAPVYRIVLAFKPPVPSLRDVQRHAHASLRGDLQLRTAKRSHAEIMRGQERLTQTMRALGGSWTLGHDPKRDRFVARVGTPAARRRLETLLPADLRGDVIVEIGPVPVPVTS